METTHSIGRRKTAIARVYVFPGSGSITVNERDLATYFTTATLQYRVMQPFTITNTQGTFDVRINVYGGGINGQAEAVRLAIARALCEISPENRETLKPEGLLTRDPRMVERKKYGRKKARKRYQFSKR